MRRDTGRPAPIAILSFNRPAYLRQVLLSLVAQEDGRLDEREIVLFQDGARNAMSGAVRADAGDIEESVRVFRAALPGRRVERSLVNLGVALNFDRAEHHVFETLDADAAIFLEDDLVLAPRYLRVLETLLGHARADDRIGHVAAYGDHWLRLAEQRERASRYRLLEHNWGFGLTRRQWLRNKPYVDAYLSVIGHADYKQRPRREVHRLYHAWGVGCPGDSQDVTKTLACVLTGAAKLNTTICLGRYIGEHGLHMNPQMFVEQDYSRTELYLDVPPDLPPPSGPEIDQIFAIQRHWATEVAYAA